MPGLKIRVRIIADVLPTFRINDRFTVRRIPVNLFIEHDVPTCQLEPSWESYNKVCSGSLDIIQRSPEFTSRNASVYTKIERFAGRGRTLLLYELEKCECEYTVDRARCFDL